MLAAASEQAYVGLDQDQSRIFRVDQKRYFLKLWTRGSADWFEFSL
jgi:hypothetical protein